MGDKNFPVTTKIILKVDIMSFSFLPWYWCNYLTYPRVSVSLHNCWKLRIILRTSGIVSAPIFWNHYKKWREIVWYVNNWVIGFQLKWVKWSNLLSVAYNWKEPLRLKDTSKFKQTAIRTSMLFRLSCQRRFYSKSIISSYCEGFLSV